MGFERDERRRYRGTWLLVAALFTGATVWAVYSDVVTRTPWKAEQRMFFTLDAQLAREALARAKAAWEVARTRPEVSEWLARRQALEESRRGGDYEAAAVTLRRLDAARGELEREVTFATSELDAARYRRSLAEYDRDAALEAARLAWRRGHDDVPSVLAVGTVGREAPAGAGPSDVAGQLAQSRAESDVRARALRQLVAGLPAPAGALGEALETAGGAEERVVSAFGQELPLVERVERSRARLVEVDGPAEPPLPVALDAGRRERARAEARLAACAGSEQTRSCLRWLVLEPVERELTVIDGALARWERPMTDAETWLAEAQRRAASRVDLGDVPATVFGPYGIRQVITRWNDEEQVDRCTTCHLGVSSDRYRAPELPRQYRTHPHLETLIASHRVAEFGCTACHQGQGRATDDRAHVGWRLRVVDGQERWEAFGDGHWDDPLLPIGRLARIPVDDRDDELALLGWAPGSHAQKPAWREPITLPHGELADDDALVAALQVGLAGALEAHGLGAELRAVVRQTDHRIAFAVVARDADAERAIPRFGLEFADRELGRFLGFGDARRVELVAGRVTALEPPALPVRTGDEARDGRLAGDGRYAPPRGRAGLQVPDEQRNRFILALPEVESGCLRCHVNEVDARQRVSGARHVESKLSYMKDEEERSAAPGAWTLAHGEAFPEPIPAPAEVRSLAPTLDEGRALVRTLNCAGCHVLAGFEPDRRAGPPLDDLSAKFTPEHLVAWLRDPRALRPKSRMPNLWPAPLDPASKQPFEPGSSEYERFVARRRDETLAVAAFLWERSENPGLVPARGVTPRRRSVEAADPAAVAGAGAALGRRMFEGYGCQGCHDRHDADVAGEPLPETSRVRERDRAPSLASVGTHTSARFLYAYLLDPQSWAPGSRMPSFRLSELEAASLALYLATLRAERTDVEPVPPDDGALVADPERRREIAPCSAVGGGDLPRWECGGRLVAERGCFGCHLVAGFEATAAVGPDLDGFAKKDLTTLDFGYAITNERLFTHESFAVLKLDAPRIFERDHVELRMGDYDLSAREIRALTVFLMGLTNDRPSERFDPAARAAYVAPLAGRALVDALACRACHRIEGSGGDLDGFRTAALEADPQARAPSLDFEGGRVQPEWLASFLRRPGAAGVRPWLHPEWVWGDRAHEHDWFAVRMPSYPLAPEQISAIVRYFATWDGESFPYDRPAVVPPPPAEQRYALTHMSSNQAANCFACHYAGAFPLERADKELGALAPSFSAVPGRLRPAWVRSWLLSPQDYLPYTKMTAFWATELRPDDAERFAGEADPFRSPPLAWTLAPSPADLTVERQVELVRDLLFTEGVPWPGVTPPSGAGGPRDAP